MGGSPGTYIEAGGSAALEMRKEGYILGCQERLERVRQVVEIMGDMSC